MIYIRGMKNYSINIKDGDVLTKIYRLTANAAVQRGDALQVATPDNVDLLTGFINDGRAVLIGALERYSTGGLNYSMPENWPDMSGDIKELAEIFLVNYAIAKWYELNGTGERFIATANEALMAISPLLNKRNKPI